MKILRKLGLTLFSLMLFCGMSMTAFASEKVELSFYAANDNTRVISRIVCNDNQKHNLEVKVKFFGDDKKQLSHENYNEFNDELSVGFRNEDKWSYAEAFFYVDGDCVGKKTVFRDAVKTKYVTARAYLEDKEYINARIICKDEKAHDLRIKAKFYDKNGNKIDLYELKEFDKRLDGGFSPSCKWSKVKIYFYHDGKQVGSQVLER
ncbi:hypothetical protein [Clostridium novyi]